MKLTATFAAIAMLSSAAAHAATYQDVSASAKVQVTESCDPSVCTTKGSGYVNISARLSITPDEEAALVSDSTILVDAFGVKVEGTLGEDPRFQDGSKSAMLSDTLVLVGGQEVSTVWLKWGNGALEIKGNVKAVIDAAEAHDSPSPAAPMSALLQGKDGTGSNKDHVENPHNGTIQVRLKDASTTTVFDEEATIITDVKRTDKKSYVGNTTSAVQIKIKLKTNSWFPISE